MNFLPRPRMKIAAVYFLAFLLIVVPLFAYASEEHDKILYQHESEHAIGVGPQMIQGNIVTDPSAFQSHLPLIILDMNGNIPPMPSYYDLEKEYRVPIIDNPYISGSMAALDKGEHSNSLADKPFIQSDIEIRLRGNSSLDYAKKQFKIKLVSENGQENPQNMLGMGIEDEWVLNLSYIDRSLIRNYLALNTARSLFPHAVETRFAEVFIKTSKGYEYLGLYMMTESIKQGIERVNILEYDPHFEQSSYIIRRDRYKPDTDFINSFGAEQGLTSGFLEIEYPKPDEITQQTHQYIEADISRLERCLYAPDQETFLGYRRLIDIQSFIDYFLINEFFMNYDAKFNSAYCYKPYGELLYYGPVWDFDQSLDNSIFEAKTDSTAMHDAVWFEQLLRDGEFVRLIVNRYRELRKDILSDEYLSGFINDTVAYLDNAQLRNGARWNYTSPEQMILDNAPNPVPPMLIQSPRDFAQEIDFMKTVLFEHAAWLDENIESLYQFSEFPPEQ